MNVKSIFMATLVVASHTLQAQWVTSPNGNTTNTVGYVGIGTASPTRSLHIKDGGGLIETATESSIQFKALTPAQSWDMGANQFGFYVYEISSGTYKFNITKGGNVGIGLNNPIKKLHVKDGGGLIEAATESSIQYKATTPAQYWDVGTNQFGFYIYEINSGTYKFTITKAGNVGIGITNPDAALAVKGNIHTQEVKIDLLGAIAPDYVFEEDYKLPDLLELKAYLRQHKHLPEVPSAQEMGENGIYLKEMNLLLLKKIEELTLHVIDQKTEILELQKAVKALQEKGK